LRRYWGDKGRDMSKMLNTIGYEIPGHSDRLVDFSSKQALMDSDIVLLNPNLPYYERSSVGDGYYQGKICYGESGSFQLREDIAHWKRELLNFLNGGRTVFFMLDERISYFVDTGVRSHSGSGRNRSTTINVEPANNYELLPIKIGVIHPSIGREVIQTGNPLFKSFFEYFKKNLKYRVYIEKIENGKPIFTGKDVTKTLGAVFKVGSGHLVLLPYLDYDRAKFIEYKKDKKGKESGYWTKEAVQFGETLVSNLIQIDKGLLSDTEKTLSPSWASKKTFKSIKEEGIENEIGTKNTIIEKAKNERKELEKQLLKEQQLKGLLYEQGKPLEDAVINALEILGYKAGNYNDGELELDQVILSPEGHRYIGECEGKDNKDIDITKFRQLVESMNADFARKDVSEKAFGILLETHSACLILKKER
jgi:hypothetical protein